MIFPRVPRWDDYEQLRTLCSDAEWADLVVDFEAEFEKSNIDRLIQLYLHEESQTEAFETVIAAASGGVGDDLWRLRQDDGLAVLSTYHDEASGPRF